MQEMQETQSGGEKGLRGSGAGTLGVPLGGTRRVGGLFQCSTFLPFPQLLAFTPWLLPQVSARDSAHPKGYETQ